MAKIQERDIERDDEGHVVGQRETIVRRKGGGGFGWGLTLGALLVIAGIVAFSYSQGSFRHAGAEADRTTAQAQQELTQSTDQARNAVHNATENGNNAPPSQQQ
ncbi:MAG: hypothetical protein ABUS48_02865 [Pseudomonadota bacterium]